MADNEPQIDLKKHARRRLVGASALALLAAIVLPMVMDHEPRQVGQDIQVRIPSQEGANYAARVIHGRDAVPPHPSLPAPLATASTPAAQTDTQSAPAVAPHALVSSPIVPPPAPKNPPRLAEDAHPSAKADLRKEPDKVIDERRAQAEARKEKAKAEAALAKAETAKSSRREAEDKPKTKDSESSRAAAILNDDSSNKPSRFAVQLGSFKDAANAATLRGKAAGEGINAYVEPAGDKTRVRAGPFPSRDAAEAAAARLRKAGIPATVTPAS